jgi:hypothetical protein
MAQRDHQVPPAGEEIHLPGSTPIPLLTAAGITIALVGVTISVVLVIAGAILTVAMAVVWIRDTRRDIDELPLEHDHG